ncbi:MAG: DUF1566 domain-containing protein [Spirochaetales bacterium]|jgi:hypothetical protein|nr:DUF1566 domain-containing protein [Spirochaetales bacterium]
MKKVLKNWHFLPFLVLALAGCSTTTSGVSGVSGGLALDTAIEQAAARMENAFEAGTEIALVSVSSPSTQFSEYVLTYLETVLVNNGKLAVVDRSNLDRIREEQGFQSSGEVSDASAKAIGQLLGAGAIVTGGLVNLGDEYRLNLKAINVVTARIAASYAGDIAGSPRILTLLASGGAAVSGGAVAAPSVRNTPTPAAAPPVPNTPTPAAAPPARNTPTPATPPARAVEYAIGDTGPGGGKIFYVSPAGFQSNGVTCHYLEAAPEDIGPLKWQSVNIQVGTTRSGIGMGAANTAAILAADPNAAAARTCDMYRTGGKDDWFLPSRDELTEMYWQKAIIGGFGTGYYWSSLEYNYSNAWAQSFSNGDQSDQGKMYQFSVRSVRAF